MPLIALVVDEKRARRQHLKHTASRREFPHSECGAQVSHTDSQAAKQATIGPLDVPPWVSIEVAGRAGFAVRCSRCGALTWLVQVYAAKPGALQAAVSEHALCVGRAA